MPLIYHQISALTKKVIIINNYEATKIRLDTNCECIYTYLELKSNSITELCFCNPAFHMAVSDTGLKIACAEHWWFYLASITTPACSNNTKYYVIHARHYINLHTQITPECVATVPTLKQMSTAQLISCNLPTDIINSELPQALQPLLKANIRKPRFSIAPYDFPIINCKCGSSTK